MGAWITITQDDIKARLSGPEFAGLLSYDLSSGQSDPIASAIALALAEVRGYIPDHDKDADETLIPPELKDTAIVIAVEKAAGRLSSGDVVMTEGRARAYEFAIQRLRDTARGQYHISSGTVTTTSETLSADGETLVGSNASFSYGGEAKLDF